MDLKAKFDVGFAFLNYKSMSLEFRIVQRNFAKCLWQSYFMKKDYFFQKLWNVYQQLSLGHWENTVIKQVAETCRLQGYTKAPDFVKLLTATVPTFVAATLMSK